MQREHGRVGRKSKGDIRDTLLAKYIQDFLTVRMALHKKLDRSSVVAYALVEAAFDPASQATPHLYTRRELWETR
jgi:hypothetical protein